MAAQFSDQAAGSMRAPLAFGGVVGRDRVAQAQNAQGVAETGEAEADAALVAGFFALPFERPGGDVAQIANFCASPGFVSVSEKRSGFVSVEARPLPVCSDRPPSGGSAHFASPSNQRFQAADSALLAPDLCRLVGADFAPARTIPARRAISHVSAPALLFQ